MRWQQSFSQIYAHLQLITSLSYHFLAIELSNNHLEPRVKAPHLSTLHWFCWLTPAPGKAQSLCLAPAACGGWRASACCSAPGACDWLFLGPGPGAGPRPGPLDPLQAQPGRLREKMDRIMNEICMFIPWLMCIPLGGCELFRKIACFGLTPSFLIGPVVGRIYR